MRKSLKELLLKDLSARLPYGVKAKVDGHINPLQIYSVEQIKKSQWTWKKGTWVVTFWNDTKSVEHAKPYLRPMSSMTKKEEKEYSKYAHFGNTLGDWTKSIDYLNAHHFDYRGLIEKGLALPAPEGMYNF